MKKLLLILNSLILIFSSTSCEKNGIGDQTVDVTSGAYVSFINLSPSSPGINLYFDDTKVTGTYTVLDTIVLGIPFRSSFPGSITAWGSVVATTFPSASRGIEYFTYPAGTYTVDVIDTTYLSSYKPHSEYITYTSESVTLSDNKYYTIYAMDDTASMDLIVSDDDIVSLTDSVKTKVRVVNGLMNMSSGVDVWLVHQPALAENAMPPYKIASGLAYKDYTSFSDTITGANYYWYVTAAGSEAIIAAPSATGSAYSISFSSGLICSITSSTYYEIAAGSTYTLIVLGKYGATGKSNPYCNKFRNRYW